MMQGLHLYIGLAKTLATMSDPDEILTLLVSIERKVNPVRPWSKPIIEGTKKVLRKRNPNATSDQIDKKAAELAEIHLTRCIKVPEDLIIEGA